MAPYRNQMPPELDDDTDDEGTLINFLVQSNPRYFYPPVPRNTSRLQGAGWIEELMLGTPERFRDALRMNRDTFVDLCDELVNRGLIEEDPSARVSTLESVGIFVRTVGMSQRCRESQERFQHSNETISRHFHRVLRALVEFAKTIIIPPDFNRVPDKIMNNPQFYPYFQDCVGAIDGTHINACITRDKQLSWRNRKGEITQNVTCICDFDMLFTYVYPGFEGSAHDSRVLFHAIEHDPTYPNPPSGKYYLVDSGYTNFPGYLAPYKNYRYHIPEWEVHNPRGPIELFNKRHAKLRNVIERVFGVLKSRFPILTGRMARFSIDVQADIVIACCALHNWVRKNDHVDYFFNLSNELPRDEENEDLNEELNEAAHAPTQQEINFMSAFRDNLTHAIWTNRN